MDHLLREIARIQNEMSDELDKSLETLRDSLFSFNQEVTESTDSVEGWPVVVEDGDEKESAEEIKNKPIEISSPNSEKFNETQPFQEEDEVVQHRRRLRSQLDRETMSNQDNINNDEDGPPPGWEFNSLVDALPKETSSTADLRENSVEELDDGPPPGWESALPCQIPPLSTVSSNIVDSEPEIKENITRNDTGVPTSETRCVPMPGQVSPDTPPLQQPSPDLPHYSSTANKDGNKRTVEEKQSSGHKPASQQLPLNPPLSSTPSATSEKAQLVCGTCRNLCVYPRGAKWVQCPGCQEVNLVLEAHEVGQVKCGGCSILLMYPHGAPAVQCSSCRFVTEIGAHNRRPPLSVQQTEARAQRRHRRFTRGR